MPQYLDQFGNAIKTLSGCEQCLRWTMFTLNILLFICSALTVAFGGYLVSTKWDEYVSADYFTTIGLFTVFGILFIVSLIGTVGLCKLHKCLLQTYSCVLMLALALQIGIVVFLMVAASDFDTNSWLEDRWQELSPSDIAWIEDEFECCGFSYDVPDESCTAESGYTEFCKDSIIDWLQDLQVMALALGAVVLTFELAGAIVSCVLIYSINQAGKWGQGRYNSYADQEYSYMTDKEEDNGRHNAYSYQL